jgi:hypothetical protein
MGKIRPIMNAPPKFFPNERLLDQFVAAADTAAQLPACDLLFIHGNDLTWGRPDHGFFLADISVDEDFEEVVQIVKARSKISTTQFIKMLLPQIKPHFIQVLKDVAPKMSEAEEDRAEMLAEMVASPYAEKLIARLDKILPEFLRQWPLFADGIASWLVRGAISLQEKQRSITGMSSDRYNAMLTALDKLDICEHVVRAAYPKGGFHFELSLTGRGEFKTIESQKDSKFVELMRLKPDLAALKRGRDNALAIFIADYLNRNFVGPNQAFSCAYYGERSEDELDVVVPALELGFEIKLYQSPFTQAENKLVKLANDLERQLPSYVNRGCKRIYYVSNLSKEMAEDVLRIVQEHGAPQVEIVPIAGGVPGGMEALLPVLKGVGELLNMLLERSFNHEVAAIMNAAQQSAGRSSKSKKSPGSRARSKKRSQKTRARKAGMK